MRVSRSGKKFFLVSSSSFLVLMLLTGCGTLTSVEGLKPRTAEENQAIQDSWYPVKSEECQLIIDSFQIISAAMGGGDIEYLSSNMDEINGNLQTASEVTSSAMFKLSQDTLDQSIKAYALEALPIFAQVGNLIADDESDVNKQMNLLVDFAKLTGKVPDGCKS